MDPEEISRLARLEKKKKKAEKIKAEAPKKKPFNPLDWMDFIETKKWMSNNLTLSNSFYSFLFSVFLVAGFITWIYLQDEQRWAFYVMIGSWISLIIIIVVGFIYGFAKAKRKKQGQTEGYNRNEK